VKYYDVIIIGAGAAGLTAAIAFRRRCEGTALIIDANSAPGVKILETGNGRCNLSNKFAPGWETTRDFFGSLGVLLDTDEPSGRAYPQSRRALTIRDALITENNTLGCEFLLQTRVTSVVRVREDDSFVANTERGAFRAKQIIIATGGKARPRYGNKGDGYAFARSLGIKVTPIRPALVPFVYEDEVKDELSALSGVRAKANVSLISYGNNGANAEVVAGTGGDGAEIEIPAEAGGGSADTEVPAETGGGGADTEIPAKIGAEDAEVLAKAKAGKVKVIAEASGEVQFTNYGLSGICIFDLSRYYKTDKRCAVRIDLAPNHTEDEIRQLLSAPRAAGLSGIVHPKIAEYIQKKMKPEKPPAVEGASSSGPLGDNITDATESAHAATIAATVKNFVAPIKGTKGWKDAQITAGGVALSEVDAKHYESKTAPGLYFAGEVLDEEGPSGGYNLDQAWSTGQKAGKAAGAYCASYLHR
jgi:predicted flavoprotein YhiN